MQPSLKSVLGVALAVRDANVCQAPPTQPFPANSAKNQFPSN